jgi:hypothetical protein
VATPAGRKNNRNRNSGKTAELGSVAVLKSEVVDPSGLTFHPKNYRRHPDDQLEHLIASIRSNGFYRNVVTARDGTVLAGQGVVQAAVKMGMNSIPIVRLPLDPDDPRALKVIVSDNEIGRLAVVDDRGLTDLLKQIMEVDPGELLGTGYDRRQLAALAYVTRREFTDFYEAAEWVGMPEYAAGVNFPQIVVTFKDRADRAKCLKVLKLRLSDKAKSTWWPAKPRDDPTSVRFVSSMLPRYPVFVPSKGRSKTPYTIRVLKRDGVPFRVVVEPQEREAYAALVGEGNVLVLPESGRGLHFARCWVKDFSEASGDVRHWQLDDNLRGFHRRVDGLRIPCSAGVALRVCEDFVDRYENVAVAGLNYSMFVHRQSGRVEGGLPPFYVNTHVYSCTLVLNGTPLRWRYALNDDTDLCLQALADGWCTVNLNAFAAEKIATMKLRGGNTDDFYAGDGRLRMARTLERAWPGVVKTVRRFRRPQHWINGQWMRFTALLRRRPGVDWERMPKVDEYGMRLVKVRAEVRSPEVAALLGRFGASGDSASVV